MEFTKRTKIILIVGSILVASAAIATPTTLILLNNNDVITVNLLTNAGVMIEANGLRIYIDPIDLDNSYNDFPADAVLITHDHGDHYQESTIDIISTDETIIAMPGVVAAISSLEGVITVAPEDSFLVGSINVTCFYMYTFAPEGYESSHPIESNYVSYLIDIDGFVIFHAGDSSNIPEYSQLQNKVDVAFLPLGPGCQTMTGLDVVNAIDMIKPTYFIPIHYSEGANEDFIAIYSISIGNIGCEIVNLAYFESTEFNI
ncbi:MAG: MBL fold metallo-hydrolase [Candidatus Heimdallarchaeota archaeon]|nr:MBL fold metallo-hydrolase [Candidatus Heimdallarchaeota archaeon]